MTRARYHGIPDPDRPDGAEISRVPVTPWGREMGMWLRQTRQWFRTQLALRQESGRTEEDYLPAAVRDGLFAGLPPSDPVFVLDARHKPWFEETMAGMGLDVADPDMHAVHSVILGLGIVWRDPEAERVLGPEYVAGLIVHERGHGASAFKNDSIHLQQHDAARATLTARHGFSTEGGGNTYADFFEEGFAERMRQRYLRGLPPDSRLLRAIRASQGLRPDEDPFRVGLDVRAPDGASISVPAIHLQPVDGAELRTVAFFGFAAQALEEMIAADPGLEEALREGRSTPDGLRAFWGRVRTLLGERAVSELRALQYDDEEGMRGLRIVREALARRAAV